MATSSAAFISFAAPEEQDRLQQALLEAQRDGSIPCELEYWIVHANGSRRYIRERYSVSVTDEINRIFIVSSDITEPIQAYQSLENAVSDRTRELATVLDVSRRMRQPWSWNLYLT